MFKQRFYDADLLREPAQQRSANATPAPVIPAAARSQTDLEAGHGKEYTPLPTPAYATPWYKTRKGIIAIVIVAIVIIGAVVGGAVGGTVGKSSNKSSNSGQAPIAGNPSSTSSSAGAGIGSTSQGEGASIGGPTSTSAAGTATEPPVASGSTTSSAGVAPIGTALAIADGSNDA